MVWSLDPWGCTNKDKFPMENIEKSLHNEFELIAYIFDEDDNAIFGEIKPEMLEGNFTEF